ncbi:hypothetical protein UFOVP754_42 [uncultured Caudovirales phage]|uniref:Uncharacterized protein n=1 Tax=uncultured Caudovirales phage TaxID=2100421 RepID=A0A6J7X8Q9_9CAUD|nr:hypothetical protein UFOVP754_42 [uncultured Caudovirales phage]
MKLKDRYFAPTPANIKRFLLVIKAVFTAAAGTAYVQGDPTFAFWIAIGTVAINEILQFTHEDNK